MLKLKPPSLGKRRSRRDAPIRKIPLEDVQSIVTNSFDVVDEELALGFEITDVQDEVERRFGQEGIDGRAFGLAQIEVQSTLFVRERRQRRDQ